jgi:3-hydroxybutyryl-CoA dehydratase
MNELRFDQLSLGMRADFDAVISAAMVDQFAALSGDRSPLHMDRDFAVAAGHKDRVVHGLLSASLFSTLVGVHLPGKNALLHEIKAGFHNPVYPGDALNVSGEITYLNEAYKQAEIKASIRGSDGKRLVSAVVKVGLAV